MKSVRVAIGVVALVALVMAAAVGVMIWHQSIVIDESKKFCEEVKIGSDPNELKKKVDGTDIVHFYTEDLSVMDFYFPFKMPWGQAWCKVTSEKGKITKVESGVEGD